MRVISQSRETDFPYEQIIVQRNENIVLAIPISNGALTKVLGEYGTPEKAEKAMEILREQYIRMETQNITAQSLNEALRKLEESGCSMKKYNETLECMMEMFIFQFPKDSEVDV